TSAHLAHAGLLRDVDVVAEVGFECRLCKGHELILRIEDQASTHDLDAVDRKHGWREADLQTGQTCPVLHAFQPVGRLCRHAVLSGLVYRRVHRVEYAAHHEWAPADPCVELARKRLDVREGKIGPGAGTIEEEIDIGHVASPQFCVAAAGIGGCPKRWRLASSSMAPDSFLSSLPTARPACTCGRARTVANHRFTLGKSSSVSCWALCVMTHGKHAMSAME